MIDYMNSPVIDLDGTKKYYNSDNQLHNDVGPAVILLNGDNYWYRNGRLHNDNGPAAIFSNSDNYWYQDNERPNIVKIWYFCERPYYTNL